jgi:soluble lytic murein transglycosylase-like protein
MRPERAAAAATTLLLLLGAERAQAQIYTRRNANGVVEATNAPDSPDFRLTYPGKGTLIHSRGFRRIRYDGRYDSHILDAAASHGVSEQLVKAVIAQESEFDPMAVSSKGARGLMQLMPATARRFGVADSFDARQNIFGGVQYLRFLLNMFGGDVALALAGYNAGENAVVRHGGVPPYRETRNYVQRIQESLSGGAGGASSNGALFLAAPRGGVSPLGPAPARAAPVKLAPARPRTYYKWRDAGGTLHVGQSPPGEGISFTTIRALD